MESRFPLEARVRLSLRRNGVVVLRPINAKLI